jgi:hypothetical protein
VNPALINDQMRMLDPTFNLRTLGFSSFLTFLVASGKIHVIDGDSVSTIHPPSGIPALVDQAVAIEQRKMSINSGKKIFDLSCYVRVLLVESELPDPDTGIFKFYVDADRLKGIYAAVLTTPPFLVITSFLFLSLTLLR